MLREQFYHAVRVACRLSGQNEVIVVGSQSILGSFDEEELLGTTTLYLDLCGCAVISTRGETLLQKTFYFHHLRISR